MGLLSRDELDDLIFAGRTDCVLRKDWASRDALRPAGYDLRIAGDKITKNGLPIAEPQDSIALAPGEVALVSTYERFCMPWHLAANIGVRFHFARRGLLVFTGLLVDPGFGLCQNGAGEWEPKKDERLNFFIANLGAASIELRLGKSGDRVLSLQFFSVPECTEKRAIEASSTAINANALAIFSDVRALEGRLDKEIAELAAKQSKLETVVGGVESATDRVVIFGVFLVAVTLLGVTAAILLEGLASDKLGAIIANLNMVDIHGAGSVMLCLAALGAMLAVALAAIHAVTRIFAARWDSRASRRSRI